MPQDQTPSSKQSQSPAWYYYMPDNRRIGPITAAQLKQLAAMGHITSETIIENVGGRREKAGNVRGLIFSTAKPTTVATEHSPRPASNAPEKEIPHSPPIFLWIILGVVLGLTAGVPSGIALSEFGWLGKSNSEVAAVVVPEDNGESLIATPLNEVEIDTDVDPEPSAVVASTPTPAPLLEPMVTPDSESEQRFSTDTSVSLPTAAQTIPVVMPTIVPSTPSKVKLTVRLITIEAGLPTHGIAYSLWANGEKIDSADDTQAFHYFDDVYLPAGEVTLEGRVGYKNGYGAVMEEKRVRRIINTSDRDLPKIVTLKINKFISSYTMTDKDAEEADNPPPPPVTTDASVFTDEAKALDANKGKAPTNVSVSVIPDNIPSSSARFELWINGKKFDEADVSPTRNHVFHVWATDGKLELEGRVYYKNARGNVVQERKSFKRTVFTHKLNPGEHLELKPLP